MKFFKRLNIYKNASGTLKYNPLTKKSTSYDWYVLSDKIGQYVVLNTYSYSSTTRRHLQKIRNQFSKTFTEVNFCIEAPNGLNDLNSAERLYRKRIEDLTNLMAKKGTHKKTNQERLNKINIYQQYLGTVLMLKEVKYREQFETKFIEDMDKILSNA
jgi:hypothetical protein